MGTHPIFESDFDCLTEKMAVTKKVKSQMGYGSTNSDISSIKPRKPTKLDMSDEVQITTISTTVQTMLSFGLCHLYRSSAQLQHGRLLVG